MKKKTRVALLGFLVLTVFMSVGSVQASLDQAPQYQTTSTVTASITSAPAYVPTIIDPTYPSDFACPEDGTVDGYGTTTPSLFWELNCSQCVITALVSSTPYVPTVTGTPPTTTNTPPISPTVTATVESTLVPNNLTFTSWTAGSGGLVPSYSCYTYHNGFYCDFAFPTPTNRRTLYQSVLTFARNGWGGNVYVVFDAAAGGNFWYEHPRTVAFDWNLGDGSYPSVGSGVTEHGSYTLGSSAVIDTYQWSKAEDGQYVTWFGTVYYQPQPILPTPVPVTPTGTPSGYCESVDGSTGGDSAFTWTGIEYGVAQCLDIGPYEVDILGIAIDIPWLAHLCLQEISIGVITAFNVVVTLDVIIAILLCAWMIRNMFIS